MSILGAVILSIGLFFMAVTAVGLLRLPDFFTRVHAVSKSETLGIALVGPLIVSQPELFHSSMGFHGKELKYPQRLP